MTTYGDVPYMRVTSDPRPRAPRVTRGMTFEQVRELYRPRAEAKAKEIIGKYYKQKAGRSGGREGLGIYGQFQSRAARAKERLAESMLKSAGLPTDQKAIGKLMSR